MSTQAMEMKLRQFYERKQEERIYTDSDVKKMLYAFARDLGCKWRADRLRQYIESGFRSERQSECKTIKFSED